MLIALATSMDTRSSYAGPVPNFLPQPVPNRLPQPLPQPYAESLVRALMLGPWLFRTCCDIMAVATAAASTIAAKDGIQETGNLVNKT